MTEILVQDFVQYCLRAVKDSSNKDQPIDSGSLMIRGLVVTVLLLADVWRW